MAKLYVAYGSNLNKEQMCYRCPAAKFVGTGIIEGYELQFKGALHGACATIAPKEGTAVPVGIWTIQRADEKRLDIYEGYHEHGHSFYDKEQISVKMDDGSTITGMVYIMDPRMDFGNPSAGYYDIVHRGYDGAIQPIAFAANQRDEVRDLHNVAGALGAQPGVKQQTFIAAGFSAGQGSKAGGVGYQEECAPTLKASDSGTNMVPSILCLNDQGGSVMECSEDVSGTLRAQEHGHQPLVYENHGIDARYTGPHRVAPTMSARYGTGGNNVPLVEQDTSVYCIVGNAIDRQPQNGGNGCGYQENIAYTLTATDHHAIAELYQETVGALCRGDEKGAGNQYVSQNKCIVNPPTAKVGLLIRRLTPLECERLQGFPDGWTNIPGASDSARYKALGNSVAIPCV